MGGVAAKLRGRGRFVESFEQRPVRARPLWPLRGTARTLGGRIGALTGVDAVMSKAIRTYEYVNHPYDGVREAILADPVGVFRSATHSAADRARSVAAALKVNVAGVEVGTEVDIRVGAPVETAAEPGRPPSTRIPIEWEAAKRPGLFPLMRDELSIYPLTATETQLDFGGTYEPPLGPLGGALDAVVGHRVADASIHRFLSDVAHHLRSTLGSA